MSDTPPASAGGHDDDRCPGCGAGVDGSWLVCAWCGGALAAPAELAPGTLLDDRYEVRRVIGRGGFGITYEVLDRRLQRRVAIKELFPPSAVRHASVVLAAPRDREAFREARDRFLREARVLARFTQPGIVHVYEVFEAHNTAYLVMELLSGRTLADLLTVRGGPLTTEEVLDLAARIGAALTSVHEAGLLHRDVNPSNVMLTDQGRVVLIDFGLARRFDGSTGESMTRAVTPGYAPPEQYAGTGEFGPACDVYSMAATLYRLLTGRTPVTSFDRQAGTPLPSPRSLRPDVPQLVSDAVLDGLEINPHHRPAGAAAFLDRLGLHEVEVPARAVLLGAADVQEDFAAHLGTRAAARAGSFGAVAAPSLPDPTEAARVAVVAPAAAPGSPAGPAASALPGTAAGPVAARGPTAVRPRPPVPLPVAAPLLPRAVGAPAASPREQPPVVGPLPRGRAWATVPAAVAAVALASAAPVVVVALLVLVLLPALATVGDVVVHRYRLDTGAASKAWHRVDARKATPAFMVRNVLSSLVRAVPGIALLAVSVGVAHLIEQPPTESVARDAVVRLGGVGATLCLLLPTRAGGRLFRTGSGINRVTEELVDARGHPRPAGWVVVVVAVALTAFGALLHPELWPLPW